MDKIHEARVAVEDAHSRMLAAGEAIETAEESADIAALEADFDQASEAVEQRKASLARLEKVAEARANTPVLSTDVRVISEEPTYRPDSPDKRSFVHDLVFSQRGDGEAMQRLMRLQAEQRDVTTGSGSGAGFIPPQYLIEYAVEVARQGRPFANILPSVPLPDTGTVLTIPRMLTGTTVAAQQEGSSVSKTDATSDQYSVNVRTIAGQQDISLQLLERSASPGFDQMIFRDLALAHATELDRELLVGASANYEHVGIGNVSSINSVSYTDASPTGGELFSQMMNAVQQVLSNRYLPPTHWIMHPRRAAWLAAATSSSPLLFQQMGFSYPVGGGSDGGVVGSLAGLPVIVDANVPTNLGSGTNQDAVYLVRADDLYLFEGPIVTRTLDQVLSGTLEVRLQLFNYSAFAGGRYPKAIAAITGTGLVAPTF